MYGVGGQQTAIARGQVSLSISSCIANLEGDSNCATSFHHTRALPALRCESGHTLELADPDFCASDSIDLLLGADAHGAIISSGIRKRGAHEPIT